MQEKPGLEPGEEWRPPSPPRPEFLRETIRWIAAETGRVDWTCHALDQMEARGICDTDVLKVLRNGEVRGNIRPGEESGEWKAKVVHRVKGAREVGIVTVVCGKERLIIVTAEWEDMR